MMPARYLSSRTEFCIWWPRLTNSNITITMEEALAKIRPHVSSNLVHQKTPAKLLIAVESALKDQKTDATPTAYFAALLTTLDGTIQKKDLSLDDGDVLPAELYLLAFIIPFVPPPVLRSNLNTVLSLTAPLFPALGPHAPALRSQLSIYQGLLKAVDRSQLEAQGIRQSFASVLQLCIDGRPKVRRKAGDVIKDIIASPPAPLAIHPYSERVAEWAISLLTEVAAGPLSKSKSKQNTPGSEIGIHLLAFLRPILPHLPPSVCYSTITQPESSHMLLGATSTHPTTPRPSTIRKSLPHSIRVLSAHRDICSACRRPFHQLPRTATRSPFHPPVIPPIKIRPRSPTGLGLNSRRSYDCLQRRQPSKLWF